MKRSDRIRTLVVVSVLAVIGGVRVYQSAQPAPTWEGAASVASPTPSSGVLSGFSKIGEFRQSTPGTSYTLSHSGDLILLGYNNHGKGHFTVRDAKTGAIVSEFSAPFGLFYFMPDGKSVVVHGFQGITAWETRSGKQLWSVATKSEEQGVPTTKGPIITTNGSELTIRAGDNGGLVRTFPMTEAILALSGDGSSILVSQPGSSTGDVVSAAAGTRKRALTLPKGSTAWRGDLDEAGSIAAILLESEKGREIGFWDLKTGTKLPATIDGQRVGQIAITRDGNSLFVQRYSTDPWAPVVGDEGDVEMWDIKGGKMVSTIRAGQFSLTPDNRTMAVNHGDIYQVWRLTR